MKEFKTLKYLDKIQFIYEKFGVDYGIMRRILQVKLTLDERRRPSILMKDINKNKEEDNLFRKSLWMYALMGVIIMLFIFPEFSLFYKMNIIYAMLVFMVMMIMISDFSSVLLDIQEKNILLPRPIDVKTINASKVTHILIHLLTITMVIAAPSLIAGSIKYGLLFGGIFLIQLLVIPGLILLFTTLLYFLILSFFDGEKLKDIINYFQIFLAIFMVIVYQFIGNIFNISDYDILFTPTWWSYFLPSTWFAAPFSMFLEGYNEIYYLFSTLMGIIAPLLIGIMYFKRVAPFFERRLQKLNVTYSKKNKAMEKREKLHRKIAGIFCWNPIEKSIFRFTQNLLSNERNLKLKLYPNLAFAAFMPILFLIRSFSHLKTFEEIFREISEGKYYLITYLTIGLLATSIPMLSTSESYRAAWIYKTLPIADPAVIYKGSLKAFIVKLMLPIYILINTGFLFVYGLTIVSDIILMFFIMIFAVILIFHLLIKRLPFSQDFEYVKHNSILTTFIAGGFCGISAYAHYFLISRDISLIPYIILVLLGIIFLWKRSMKMYS